MTRLTPFLVVAAALLAPRPARADLIELKNGLIYDTVQNLTWLQDTHYARTSGYDADGWMTHEEAVAWTESLTFGGFDDWRLPVATHIDFRDHSSEISTLLTQLGWHWPTSGLVEVGSAGPFLNFFSTRDNAATGIPMYWLSRYGTIWNMIYVFDFRDGINSPSGVWAVRDGNPLARVPEPSTLLILGIGVAVLGARTVGRRPRLAKAIE